MGKADTYSKDLMQNNEYFADTVNNVLFSGKEVVFSDELVELDTTELTIVEDIVNENISIQKYRDVLKQAVIRKDGKAIYAIIGIENQTSVNYAMPVKNLLYDAMRYAKQIEKKTAEHKTNKSSMSKEEFLSGWKKSDTLIPIITITVYYGADSWDGPLSIHDMFEKDINSDILSLIPEYKIHLLEPCKISNWSTFNSDIGLLFESIVESKTEYGLESLMLKNPDRYRHVDNKIVNAINFYTKSNFWIDEEKEETDMCYATQTTRARDLIQACIDFGKSLKETIEYVKEKCDGISESYITEKYNSLKKN